MNEQKILIVEDDDTLAAHMQEQLINTSRKFKSVDNKSDAITNLRTFSPHLVLLDLNIFGNKVERAIADPIYGTEVAKEVENLNYIKRDLNIQIIYVTASLQAEHVKRLVEQGRSVHSAIDKGADDFYEQLCNAVDSALTNPLSKEITIPYEGLSPELLEKLKQSSAGLFNLLDKYILVSFNKKNYFECIIRCRSFVKCLYDEFTFTIDKGKEDLKARFNNYSKKERPEEIRDWVKEWDKVAKKGKIREIDKNFAVAVFKVRNSPAHDGEKDFSPQGYTIDDAATVMQLLVPLVNSYIEFKQKNR